MNQKNSSGSINFVLFGWFCLVRQHLPCQQRYNFEFAIFSQIVSQTQIYFEGPVFDSFIAMLVLHYGYDNDWQSTLNIRVLSAFDNVFFYNISLGRVLKGHQKMISQYYDLNLTQFSNLLDKYCNRISNPLPAALNLVTRPWSEPFFDRKADYNILMSAMHCKY